MPRIALTDLSIRSLETGGSRTDFWDSKLPAFGIRVSDRTKTFVVKHRNRRYTLGHFPDQLSLADARTKAKKILAAEPVPGASLTFREALDRFLDTHCERIRTRTKYDYQKSLRRHFLPKLATKRLDEITTSEVTGIVDRLVKETPAEANHAFMYGRTFFRWAQKRRYIVRSPLDGLGLPTKSPTRARVLTDEELKSLWHATSEPAHFNCIVRLLLLTGQRRGEVAALRKEWICDNVVTLPPNITKNGRSHSFPIGPLSLSVISSAGTKNDGLIFPSLSNKGSTPFNGWSKSKSALDRKCLISGWTLHDLRRTFASNLAALGVRLEVTEKLLNHVSGSFAGVAGIYNRYDFIPEMRAAIGLWEVKLKIILGEP